MILDIFLAARSLDHFQRDNLPLPMLFMQFLISKTKVYRSLVTKMSLYVHLIYLVGFQRTTISNSIFQPTMTLSLLSFTRFAEKKRTDEKQFSKMPTKIQVNLEHLAQYGDMLFMATLHQETA